MAKNGEVRSAVGEVVAVEKLRPSFARRNAWSAEPRNYKITTKVPTVLLSRTGESTDAMQELYFRERPNIFVGDKVRITIAIGEDV